MSESSLTLAGLRDLAAEALRRGVPMAQGRVHPARDWPLPASGNNAGAASMPALLVYADRKRRTTLSRGLAAPQYRTLVTLTVVARAEGRTEREVERQLDELFEQIDAAILRNADFVALCEEIPESEALRDIRAQGEAAVGQWAVTFDLQFTEVFEPVGLPPFAGVRMVLDAREPFDARGDYPAIAPFPPPAPPPRASGPDGRAEAEVVVEFPQQP